MTGSPSHRWLVLVALGMAVGGCGGGSPGALVAIDVLGDGRYSDVSLHLVANDTLSKTFAHATFDQTTPFRIQLTGLTGTVRVSAAAVSQDLCLLGSGETTIADAGAVGGTIPLVITHVETCGAGPDGGAGGTGGRGGGGGGAAGAGGRAAGGAGGGAGGAGGNPGSGGSVVGGAGGNAGGPGGSVAGAGGSVAGAGGSVAGAGGGVAGAGGSVAGSGGSVAGSGGGAVGGSGGEPVAGSGGAGGEAGLGGAAGSAGFAGSGGSGGG